MYLRVSVPSFSKGFGSKPVYFSMVPVPAFMIFIVQLIKKPVVIYRV